MKCTGSTGELRRELEDLSAYEEGGIRSVAVKCLDITKNSDRVGSFPYRSLTLRHEGAGIKQD